MGKTPKKAAPGGDESNLYVRRLKATTTASSKACDTSLPARQRESENSNRGKAIGTQKRLPVPVGKVFKSKLRSPTTKSHKPLKNPPRFQPSTSKDEKKTETETSTVSKERKTIEAPTMYPESEEAAVQLKVSITKKDVKDGGIIIVDDENSVKDETSPSREEHGNSNGKDVNDSAETKIVQLRDESEKKGKTNDNSVAMKEQQTVEEKLVESRDNGNESTETINNDVKPDESESEHPSSEFEDNALKLEDEPESVNPSEINDHSKQLPINGHNEKNVEETKETVENPRPNESSEKCSIDVVESTTSETGDSGIATQQENGGEDDQSKNNPDVDGSFVSYDSSIMLKDVQIKLNDCLKENSKLFDVSNVNGETTSETNVAEQQKRLDMSFGKTLRNISGRSTINRLRYVTVREHRFSPNSSLFVNTSSVSLDPDDSASCTSFRQSNELSDTLGINSTPADRKRKFPTEVVNSAKKLKTATPERPSFFNTSMEVMKHLRKPVQVSTPKSKGYQFTTEQYSTNNFDDEKLTVDAEVEPKKWCVVM